MLRAAAPPARCLKLLGLPESGLGQPRIGLNVFFWFFFFLRSFGAFCVPMVTAFFSFLGAFFFGTPPIRVGRIEEIVTRIALPRQ